MANNCDYEAQLNETSGLIADELGIERWRLVFQSRSGSPAQRNRSLGITTNRRYGNLASAPLIRA